MIRFIIALLFLTVGSLGHSSLWGSLTSNQKKVLIEYRSVWHLLLPSQQKVLEAGAFRVSKADAEDSVFFQAEYEKWRDLDLDKRRELEQRWVLFKVLPFEERRRIKVGLAHFKKLPKEKQESIRYLLREAD